MRSTEKSILCLIVSFRFLISVCYSQDTLSSIDLKPIYDSAKREFQKFEEKHGGFVQTQNVLLHYLEWGNPNDTPLIWIHGSFTNGYEIADIANDLVKNGYYLIAIDYYGHGQTKIPNHEVSLYHVADDIQALMKAKEIQKAVIGGWSRGGIIATAFYDEYPDKVLGLILEDGGSVATNTHYHKMEVEVLRNKVTEIFEGRVVYPLLDTEFEAYSTFYDYEEGGTQFELLAWLTQNSNGKWTIGSGIEELFNMFNETQFLNTILRPTAATLFGESMAMIEPKIVYRNLHVPMLILDPVSDTDIFPYEQENQQLKNQHPELITHKIYEDTGHNIHYEKPKEFTEDLERFLLTLMDYWSKKTND